MWVAAEMEAEAGGFLGPAVEHITHAHGHSDDLIKGGSLVVLRDDNDPAPAVPAGAAPAKADFILCEGAWYKLEHNGRKTESVRWRDEFDNVHSVEHSLENSSRFDVHYFCGRERRIRSLGCDNEGDRDDWVVLFRALLTNFYQRIFEKEIIPAPAVYQWHINCHFTNAEKFKADPLVILVLSTAQILVVATGPRRILSAFTPGEITGLERFSQQAEAVRLHCSGEPVTLITRDPVEAMTTVAEIVRLVKMSKGAGDPALAGFVKVVEGTAS